ncbi:NINE protein [Leptospira wolbachii]|uniref:NINE protein n=1 Tax=Leptospira wolbachii TaxID=29511 RepID=UPI000685E1DB
MYKSEKSRIIALILCIFGGFFGLHLFYVGRGRLGFIYLVTGGIIMLGWILDIVLIFTGNFKDNFEANL